METENSVPIVPETPTINQTPVKNFSSKLLILLILLVIILTMVVGITVGYLLGFSKNQAMVSAPIVSPSSVISSPTPMPTPDSTANWKTYTNSNLSFQLKYPADLVLQEKKVLGTVKLNFSIEDDSLLINSSVYQMDISQLKDWVVEHGPNGKSGIGYFPSAEKITSSTRGAYSTVEFDDYIPGQSTLIHSVAFSLNNKAYVFTLVKSADFGKLFDQILSTFKFLE